MASKKRTREPAQSPPKKRAGERAGTPRKMVELPSDATSGDKMLAEVIERAAPELMVRLKQAHARGLALSEVAAILLQDFKGNLRVAVDKRESIGKFVAAQTPSPEIIHASLAKTLEHALHCVVVLERGENTADLGYLAIEIEEKALN